MRALAVIPVCWYHAGLPGFPGGFAGVDVFFVISGYLMATLIGRDLAVARFSLLQFYERRARRILPALFAMLLACCIAGAFLIPPKLFSDFGATLAATVLFASNLVFWRKSANYFDASTDWSVLVHTWSLGVEEQFYILFPVFLWLVWRTGQRARLLLTVAVALGSLVLSIWGTANAPTATFYLLPMRAWELLVGAIVALAMLGRTESSAEANSRPTDQPARLQGLAGLVGLAAVCASLVCFDKEMPFPGAAALLPCIGTCLLLYSGTNASSPAARLLSLRPLTFIGSISYSLYLWHWPLLVFVGKYGPPGLPEHWTQLVVVGVACLAAYASWRWIEQPFRGHRSGWSRQQIFGFATAAAIALIAVGMFAVDSSGWPERFPGIGSVALEPQLAAESTDAAWNRFDEKSCFVVRAADWKDDGCFLTRGGTHNVLLWGDSFAAAHAYGFFTSSGSNLNVLQYTAPQCPPIVGYAAASRPECSVFNGRVLDVVGRHHIATVIMAANWDSYIRRRKLKYADIGATVAYLRDRGLRVVLVGQSPVFSFAYPDDYFFRAYGLTRADREYFAPVDLDPDFNLHVREAAHPDAFFDPLKLICHGTSCEFKRGPLYLFEDYGHYSHFGSATIVSELLRVARSTAGAQQTAQVSQ
jgi:peptidoglycan/LPS O-acetylase OafA/YrhL